jgi:hypothetical protein
MYTQTTTHVYFPLPVCRAALLTDLPVNISHNGAAVHRYLMDALTTAEPTRAEPNLDLWMTYRKAQTCTPEGMSWKLIDATRSTPLKGLCIQYRDLSDRSAYIVALKWYVIDHKERLG